MLLGLVRPTAGAALIDGRRYADLDRRTGRVDQVLDRVGLSDVAERRIRTYSLGMRQRLGLATALLADPAALLLDEPANGLDPAGIAWLRGLMRDLAAEGRTVLVSSHVLSEVAQIADRVVIVTGGQLRYAGPVTELGGPDALESAFLQLTGAAIALDRRDVA
jgi:ABC-2 type transport system ATP-binding protein